MIFFSIPLNFCQARYFDENYNELEIVTKKNIYFCNSITVSNAVCLFVLAEISQSLYSC